MEYTTYNYDTGMIIGNVFTNDENHLIDTIYIEGNYNSDTHYIVDGEVVERPLLSSVISINKTTFTADGTDVVNIISLPTCVVAVVKVDDDLYPTFNDEVTDGELNISTETVGIYKVTIECFPYQKYVVDLEAE